MERKFKDKKIVILSPQPWNHLFISKHHYAKELAKQNDVFYVSAPSHKWTLDYTVKIIEKRLALINFSVLVPDLVKFKLPWLYKSIVKRSLKKILKQEVGVADFSIDFGCYQFFDSIDFLPAKYKIFFPVDDFPHLTGDMRGSDIVLTVSKEIARKFRGSACHFINHGLSEEFETKAISEFRDHTPWRPFQKTRVGYAGNILLKFINFQLFENLIRSNPESEFHFFGSHDSSSISERQFEWLTFLKQSENVILHGWVNSTQLVDLYQEIDLFVLCYQPDYQSYHGENSHKILEYLSTGKVVVSSFISLYDKTGLLEMDNAQGDQLGHLFKKVVDNLKDYNSIENMQTRRAFALDNTYKRQLSRIEQLMNEA